MLLQAEKIRSDSVHSHFLGFNKISTISNATRQGWNNNSKPAFRFAAENNIIFKILRRVSHIAASLANN